MIEQAPIPVRVTVAPDTVHTVAGEETNVTGSPEPDVALNVKGFDPYCCPLKAPNVMVYWALAIVLARTSAKVAKWMRLIFKWLGVQVPLS